MLLGTKLRASKNCMCSWLLSASPACKGFLWRSVKLYQRAFSVYHTDQVTCVTNLMCCIVFIDIHVLKEPWISGIKTNWLWHMIFLMWSLIQGENILLRHVCPRFSEFMSRWFSCYIFNQFGYWNNVSFLYKIWSYSRRIDVIYSCFVECGSISIQSKAFLCGDTFNCHSILLINDRSYNFLPCLFLSHRLYIPMNSPFSSI